MKSILRLGERFGRLVVCEDHGGRPRRYLCQCDCGKRKSIVCYQLTSGKSRSCGCLREEGRKDLHRSHGMRDTKEYKAWAHAKQRCHNPSNEKFKWYGARGISMCAEWLDDFESFYAHIGPAPLGYELDRIDNDLGYQPGNVRWVPRAVNVQNRRNTIRVAYNGQEMLLEDYAKAVGISYATAWARFTKHPHLIAGEPQRKGGEKNSNAKLSDDEAADIRKSTEPTKVLCERYGVSRTLVQGIRRGAIRPVTAPEAKTL